MRAGNLPAINQFRTMVISLSVICAAVINLLLSDCVIMTAAMHVSPLSSGISSESSDDPIQLDAYGLFWVTGVNVYVGRACPPVALGASGQSICIAMLRAGPMNDVKMKLLQFRQPARQHSLNVFQIL